MREVDLSLLPKTDSGKIIWKNIKNIIVSYTYDNLKGNITILNSYIKPPHGATRLKILLNNEEYDITTKTLTNCRLGKLLGVKSSEFRYEVGQEFGEVVIEEQIRKTKQKTNSQGYIINEGFKYYKCYCKICKQYFIVKESTIKRNLSNDRPICKFCNNKLGTRTPIGIEYPNFITFFKNQEDAFRFSSNSAEYVELVCPICGNICRKQVCSILKNGGTVYCEKCAYKKYYPERFMKHFLEQLEINFIEQFAKSNSEWCGNKRYDFYFKVNNEEYIIETHGSQHYKGDKKSSWTCLKDIQKNDQYKYELAISNGIKPENYIILDCRKSELEWIKNSILNSKLTDIFSLDNIDWDIIENKTRENNLTKIAKNMWDNGATYEQIEKEIGLNKQSCREIIKTFATVREINKRKENPPKNLHKIICVETGEIFCGLVEVEEKLGVPSQVIRRSIRSGKISKKYKLTFIEDKRADDKARRKEQQKEVK